MTLRYPAALLALLIAVAPAVAQAEPTTITPPPVQPPEIVLELPTATVTAPPVTSTVTSTETTTVTAPPTTTTTTPPPPPPPPVGPTAIASNITTNSVQVFWLPADATVTEIGRDGVDSLGAGPWSGPPPAAPAPAVFTRLLPDTVYNFFAIVDGQRLEFSAKTLAVNPPTPTPTPTATTTAPPPTPNSGPLGVPGTWTLKFSDDFNGTSLDLNKWTQCWFPSGGDACGTMNPTGSGGYVTKKSNVKVENGNAVLTSNADAGALISSNPNGGDGVTGFQQGNGVFEARVYFPGNGSRCYNWDAWWTTGQNWPGNGENDIAEVLGGDMTVNYWSNWGARNQGAVPGYWCGAFHTYTLVRKPGNRSDVYYDGKLVKSYDTNDSSSLQYLLFVAGTPNASPGITGAASQVKIDYVRVWG